jgi:hypothetical protein
MAATIPGKAIGDANGHVIFPSQSAFLARPTSTQDNIPINSNTTIAFGIHLQRQLQVGIYLMPLSILPIKIQRHIIVMT